MVQQYGSIVAKPSEKGQFSSKYNVQIPATNESKRAGSTQWRSGGGGSSGSSGNIADVMAQQKAEQQRQAEAKRIADQQAKDRAKADQQTRQENIQSGTIAGQLSGSSTPSTTGGNIIVRDFSGGKITNVDSFVLRGSVSPGIPNINQPIQQIGSPVFLPSEATPNQIELPTNESTTYAIVGLGSALFGVGKNIVGRFTGKDTGDILAPLDATVIPKVGKGVYDLNGTLLDTSHLTGFQKKQYEKFGLTETTYGDVQSGIDTTRQEKVTTEQTRVQNLINSGNLSFENATTSFNLFQEDVYKSNPDIVGIDSGRKSPLRDVVDLAAFTNPLTSSIGLAVSSKDDPVTINVKDIKNMTDEEKGISIEGLSTARLSGRTTGFLLGTVIGGGLELYKAGQGVTSSGIEDALARSVKNQKGIRVIQKDGFTDIASGIGYSDDIVAVSRIRSTSVFDDAGNILTSSGQTQQIVVGKSYFAGKPFIVGGSQEFSATSNVIKQFGDFGVGSSKVTSQTLTQFSLGTGKGGLSGEAILFPGKTGGITTKNILGFSAKVDDIVLSGGGKVSNAYVDILDIGGSKSITRFGVSAPIETTSGLKIIGNAPDNGFSLFRGAGGGSKGGTSFAQTFAPDIFVTPQIIPPVETTTSSLTTLGINLPRYVGGTGVTDIKTQSIFGNFKFGMTGGVTGVNEVPLQKDFVGDANLYPKINSNLILNIDNKGNIEQKPFIFSRAGAGSKQFQNPIITTTPLQSPFSGTIPKSGSSLKELTKLKTPQKLKQTDPFGIYNPVPNNIIPRGGFGFTPFGGFGLPKLPSFKKSKKKPQRGKQLTRYQPSFTASALNIRAIKAPSITGLSIRPIISSKAIKKKGKAKRKK